MSVIRRALPGEEGEFAAHLLRLSPEDRRRRFCGMVADEVVQRYAAASPRLDRVLVGCFSDGRMRGAAEVGWTLGERTEAAEFAVSVEQDHQGLGIGRRLVERVLAAAANRAVRNVHCYTLSDNLPMRRLIRRLGGTQHFADGLIEGRFVLDGPTRESMAAELVGESGAYLQHAVELQTRWWLDLVKAA